MLSLPNIQNQNVIPLRLCHLVFISLSSDCCGQDGFTRFSENTIRDQKKKHTLFDKKTRCKSDNFPIRISRDCCLCFFSYRLKCGETGKPRQVRKEERVSKADQHSYTTMKWRLLLCPHRFLCDLYGNSSVISDFPPDAPVSSYTQGSLLYSVRSWIPWWPNRMIESTRRPEIMF